MYAQSEWILRDHKLGLVGKRKATHHAPTKVISMGKNTVVVQEGKNIVVWRVKENETQKIETGFSVASMAVTKDKRLFVSGDCEMKTIIINF